MSGEMTDARRMAMGWRKSGLTRWEHPALGDVQWHPSGVDRVVPLQEEITRLKAELAELRKPEPPTEWAAGQVWSHRSRAMSGRPSKFVVLQEDGGLLTLPIDDSGRLLGSAQMSVGQMRMPPNECFEYLGTYRELFGGQSDG